MPAPFIRSFRIVLDGSLILASLFFISFSRAENGTLSEARFASCGKTECVTIKKGTAYSSFAMLIIDFPNSELQIRPHNGKVTSYSAEDIFYDAEKIVLRNVAELNGHDAVYDLHSEQFTHF